MTGEKKMFSYEKKQDPQREITFGDGKSRFGQRIG
jgi:hypothetical protein